MKYKITVNEKTYEVEVENINARPVIAHVDGERFEVMPQDADQAETRQEAIVKTEKKTPAPNPVKAASSSTPEVNGRTLTAPLPGTVVEIFVKAGDQVEAGHVMLVIEAMKMKNSIRSVYSGRVSEVLVDIRQSVAHKQALIKFADQSEA
jgi:glutaconyl-CoA/methylmalonyl-CoA decarboxylase subunit gamma